MISCVFFDIGNVCIYYDQIKSLQSVAHLSGLSVDALEKLLENEKLMQRYSVGGITFSELHKTLEKRSGRRMMPNDLRKALCMGFSSNPEIEPLLWSLKKRNIPMYAISNTCEAHFDHLYKMYPVLRLFQGYILSHEVHCEKPDPKIFMEALAKAGVAAKNCVYIDDIKAFVDSAKELGIPSFVYRDMRQLEKDLGSIGL